MGSFDLRLLCFLGQVPEDILVERVVGRRLDPVTGKIYHLKYSPPETEEIAARLTQRLDDTEEKLQQRVLELVKHWISFLSLVQCCNYILTGLVIACIYTDVESTVKDKKWNNLFITNFFFFLLLYVIEGNTAPISLLSWIILGNRPNQR